MEQLKVLVIEDDAAVRDVLVSHLETKRYSVASCETAEDALRLLTDLEFDLVISDIKLAGLNGFEFLKLARAKYPRIGIVLMTAYEEEYPLSAALRAGADGYLTKPFSLSKFSLIFERAYWNALSRQDWWAEHEKEMSR